MVCQKKNPNVKGERANLNAMTIVLNSIIN